MDKMLVAVNSFSEGKACDSNGTRLLLGACKTNPRVSPTFDAKGWVDVVPIRLMRREV